MTSPRGIFSGSRFSDSGVSGRSVSDIENNYKKYPYSIEKSRGKSIRFCAYLSYKLVKSTPFVDGDSIVKVELLAPPLKMLFAISFIVRKITSGPRYCFIFSSPINSTIFGAIKSAITITISQITEYRILLIAGFTFSSFHPERISMTPHHTMNKTAHIIATRTTIATPVVIIFQAV